MFDVIDAAADVPQRLRLTWYRAPSTPQPGEQWQLTVRLKRRNGFANPGGFDYEGHLFREGIGAVGYVRDDAGNRRLQVATHRYAIVQARAWIGSRIAAAMGDHPMLGVLQGLAIGDTSAMKVGAVASVRRDGHDSFDGDLRSAYRHGRDARGVGRVVASFVGVVRSRSV